MECHLVTGAACFALLALIAIVTNYGGVAELLDHRPLDALVVLLGAALAFAPILLCVAIGSVRRGEQCAAWPDLRD